MNAAFPRILTLLRKERGTSQKKAAADLQVSQALLSHYEKGIRECGLDFVVRVADYYGVSCDYLLGRTADKSGAMIAVDEALRAGGYEAKLILQVHDELIVEAPEAEAEAVRDLLRRCMEGIVSLSVPLRTDISIGGDWRACK